MALSEQDRIDIRDLINLHGHLTDAGRLDEADELFTPDVVYDLTDFGLGSVQGTAVLREATRALGDRHPVGHHVTNIVITGIDADSARVRAKGIAVNADGTAGSVVYDDTVVRGADGWRIGRRTVTARRAPLGGRAAGPREVLERLRQAAISQSAEEMGRVYAVDAVHEFPFNRPGVPARLAGRAEIVGWITANWENSPLRYDRYRTLAIHDTADSGTIVVEQEAVGTSVTTGDFALPNLMILTTCSGEISHLRDYVDVCAAATAIGR